MVTAAVGALSIGSTLLDSSTSGAEKAAKISSDVGGIGGALAGSAAGAALGSVVPFIGTAIGGLIGGIAGGFGGEWLGSKIGKWFLPDAQTIKSVPAVASAGGTSTTTVNAPITIHAAPGMDERKIAEQVGKHVELALDKRHAASRARQRGALYDTGYG